MYRGLYEFGVFGSRELFVIEWCPIVGEVSVRRALTQIDKEKDNNS